MHIEKKKNLTNQPQRKISLPKAYRDKSTNKSTDRELKYVRARV